MSDEPLAVPAMDARIRARRIAVLRDAGRKRLRRMAVAGSVLALVALGWLTTRSPLLDVDHIEVNGAIRTSADEIRDASGVDSGDPLVEVDGGAVAERIEALPWVDAAHVDRSFPNGVTIIVRERKPVAVVAHERQLALVDDGGRVLDTVASVPAGLVVVEVADAVPAPGNRVDQDVRDALDIAQQAAGALHAAVRAVRHDDHGLALALQEGGVVRLGDAGELDAKLVAVATILDQVDRRCLAVLDVRVATSPVLTRQPGCL
jgi:cell division protein FtsQ